MTKPTMLNLKKDVTYEKLISISKIEAQIYSSLIATSQFQYPPMVSIFHQNSRQTTS